MSRDRKPLLGKKRFLLSRFARGETFNSRKPVHTKHTAWQDSMLEEYLILALFDLLCLPATFRMGKEARTQYALACHRMKLKLL
jgi:hypothetical protein